MKILITGACGHIGSYFIENLYKIKKVKKAILIDNLKSNRFNSLFNTSKKNKVAFYLKDLNDIQSLDQFKGIGIVFLPIQNLVLPQLFAFWIQNWRPLSEQVFCCKYRKRSQLRERG